MKKILFMLFTFLFACGELLLNVYAQPTITWNRLYEGGFNDDDYGFGICRTIDGNYVIGGSTEWAGTLALKIDAYGNVLWLKHYNATYGQATTASNDGGFLLVSPSFLKLNSSGDSIWYKNYPGHSITNLYDVMQCSDGGYLACGRSYYDSGYVMKTDINGNFLWNQIISDSILSVRLYAVNEANSGGYLVAGLKAGFNAYKSIMGKFGFNGERQWLKIYGEGDSLGRGVRILRTAPNYLVGCRRGFMKIDEQGNVISAKLILLNFNDEIEDMQIINNNRFIIVTTNLKQIPPILTSKIHIIDSNGVTLSSQNLQFSNFISLFKVLPCGNGDMIFCGTAARFDTSNADVYVLRTDSSLNFPPIGVENVSKEVPERFEIFQNYPNPFNPISKIKFQISKLSEVKLVIFDILGKEIEILVNKQMQPGIYEIIWNGSNYPSGVYFCRIESGSFVETKKMVLIK